MSELETTPIVTCRRDKEESGHVAKDGRERTIRGGGGERKFGRIRWALGEEDERLPRRDKKIKRKPQEGFNLTIVGDLWSGREESPLQRRIK